ncbi:hypothetical protein Vi05172_g7103 [Venturia inaequalis]|nr:hypothetical protein Vi05172_g7103 [Venturia inaequalis]
MPDKNHGSRSMTAKIPSVTKPNLAMNLPTLQNVFAFQPTTADASQPEGGKDICAKFVG